MKRITSLLLLFIYIFFTMTVLPASAEAGLSDKQKSLLGVLGVYDEALPLDTALTRGEFSIMLAKAAFGANAKLPLYISDKRITDVDEFNECFEAVNALYSAKLITLDNFGRFFPDELIVYKDAVSMMGRVLGYSDQQINSLWGGAVRFALAKKLSGDVSVEADGEVSQYAAYVLIYNMLYTNIADLLGETGHVIYMSNRLGIYEIDGIVRHDGIVSDGFEKAVGLNEIAIDGEVLTRGCGYLDLFAQRVSGFYQYEKGDSKKVLLSVYANEKLNDVITLTSADIVSCENRIYKYSSDGNTTKLVETAIPKDATILYNEKRIGLYDPFEDAMFTPQNGRVRLYDHDSDGKIDIVRIEDFSVGVVVSTSSADEKIYVDNLRNIDLGRKDYIIEGKDGKSLEISDISKKNVVSWGYSFDGRFVKIVVSDYSYSDVVIEYSSDDHGVILTESGGKYELSAHAAANYGKPEVGLAYNFYFDAFDRLAGYEKDTGAADKLFGLTCGMVKESRLSSDVIMRIYTQMGEFVDYPLNDKVRMLGEDDSVRYLSRDEIYTGFDYTGIIRYRLNGDGEVAYIEVPLAYGRVPEVEDRMYYLLDTYIHGDSDDYYISPEGTGTNIAGEAFVLESTYVFQRNSDATVFSDYALGNVDSFARNGKYSMFVIGTDYRKKIASAVVMFQTLNKQIKSEYPFVIKKISRVYEEKKDQEAYKLDLINVNASESTKYMTLEDFEKVYAVANGVTTPITLQAGDWIYFTADGDYIIKATCAYDIDQEVLDEQGNTLKGAIAGTELSYYSSENRLSNPFRITDLSVQNSGESDSWSFYGSGCKIFTGWVYSCQDGYIQITNQNPAYGMDLSKGLADGVVMQIFSHNRGVLTEVGGGGKVTVRALTDADVKSYLDYGADCSRVAFAQYQYARRMVNVINE